MSVLTEIKKLLDSYGKDLDGLFARLNHIEKDWDKELDNVNKDLAYIKGRIDESVKHNSSLIESHKKTIKDQQRLIKWFMLIVIALIIIIATMLGVKVPLP